MKSDSVISKNGGGDEPMDCSSMVKNMRGIRISSGGECADSSTSQDDEAMPIDGTLEAAMDDLTKPLASRWEILEDLGDGSFSTVRLLYNPKTEEYAAGKFIARCQEEAGKKDEFFLKMLKHENIVRFIETIITPAHFVLVMEWACGGELFDKIEPDSGMEEEDAQHWFRQLISGVEYMHKLGICHRDLKPENLLIDVNDNLRISDFGYATFFRHKGIARMIHSCVGSVYYMAPEVYKKTDYGYDGEKADIFSCGMILLVMLLGARPWKAPCESDPGFKGWAKRDPKILHAKDLWGRLDSLQLSLIQKMLEPKFHKRATLTEIKRHRWLKKTFHLDSSINGENSVFDPLSQSPVVKRHKNPTSATQPIFSEQVNSRSPIKPYRGRPLFSSIANFSFSQPTCPQEMLIPTQLGASQDGSQATQNPYHRLVKRMTRFLTTKDPRQTISHIKRSVENMGFVVRKATPSGSELIIRGQDTKKCELTIKAHIIEMGHRQNEPEVLVDFRLSKGDGLEFKRTFIEIKQSVKDILRPGLVSWEIAAATNCVP